MLRVDAKGEIAALADHVLEVPRTPDLFAPVVVSSSFRLMACALRLWQVLTSSC